jgi:hypothetical protein
MELKKKKLKFVENYSFKEEHDKSWSFKYKRKKAFILNLGDSININVITPFIMRRSQLGIVCEKMFYELEHNIEPVNVEDFFAHAIEIISNMLDNKKMGSIENFINYIWDNIKENGDLFKIISVLSDLVTMIDLSVEKQLEKYSQAEMKQIHDDFFNKIMSDDTGGYFTVKDGIATPYELKKKDDSEDEYDLANMIPINREEI